MTFEEWYSQFQGALADESRLGFIRADMNPEDYRKDYEAGMSPEARADQVMADSNNQ